MFQDPQIFFVFVLFGAVLYWLVPSQWYRTRSFTLMGISALAIYMASPEALILCLIASAGVTIGSHGMARLTAQRSMWIAVGAFFLLFLLSRQFLKVEGALITLGISFYFLKSTALLIDSFHSKKPMDAMTVFLMNLFFPIYAAGPLAQADRFNPAEITQPFNWRDTTNGAMRIAIGVFKASFLVSAVLDPFIRTQFGTSIYEPGVVTFWTTWAFVILSFISLYIGFSGYTDMAVGASLFFGLRVPENFRLPFIAWNIQEFWKRWHMSLVAITNKYIFSPAVRNTGNIALGIFGTFVFMGLWHQLSWPYLFWGILHGCGMYFVFRFNRYKKTKPEFAKLHNKWPFRILGWVMTMGFVAWLSAFANTGGLEESIALTRNLTIF